MSDLTTPEGCDTSSTAQARATTRSRGRMWAYGQSRLLAAYGLWIAVALIYWPSALGLNALWTQPSEEEPFTHGYLVLALSLWLIFRDRKRLAAAPVRAAPRALIPLLLLSALWAWAWRADIQEAHMMLLPLLLLSAVAAALGWRIARLLAFPIGYLYFAMPMWTDINGFVQTLSAKMSALLIWITGLPAYLQGNYIHLPGGTIEVAQTCSGLHALIVGLALAALYGELSGEPLRHRLQWIGVMGALSLIVNWVRIFAVLVAAYFSDMHSSLVKNHYWLGWWLFAAGFAGFLWWTGRQPVPHTDRHTDDGHHEMDRADSRPRLAPLGLTLLVLALIPALAYGMDWTHSGSNPPADIEWPGDPAGWSGPEPLAGGAWRPHYIRDSGESLARYTDASGHSIDVFAVAYRVQTQHAKLLSYWNSLLGPLQDGQLHLQSTRIVKTRSGQWRQMRVADSKGAQSLIWFRYRIGNHLFVRPRLSQIWYGLEALVLHPPISSLTALRTACTPDCTAAHRRLDAATDVLRPSIY